MICKAGTNVKYSIMILTNVLKTLCISRSEEANYCTNQQPTWLNPEGKHTTTVSPRHVHRRLELE
jgi:hypothetical protein